MSWTLDIIIVVIAVITVMLAAKNGFVKTAISAVAGILAIFITIGFSAPLAEYIKSTPVAEAIITATEQQISDAVLYSSNEIGNILEGQSEEFNQLLSAANISIDDINKWYSENVTSNSDAEKMLAEQIAAPIIDVVAMIISVIVLYVGSRIILSILGSVLNNIAKLPILRSCNKLLGVILGVALAAARILLFCFIMNALMENQAFLGNDYISALDPDKTLLFNIFNDIDVFSFLIK